MIGKIKIEAVEKTSESITVDWDVSTLDSFRARLLVAESLAGYDEATIERDDVEIFGGRIQNPRINFGPGGTGMTVEGFDYTVMLQDFLTPAQNIANHTTADALAHILENWPHSHETTGIFFYISLVEDWQTSIEFLMDIELYTDTCIEFAITDPEINYEFRDGAVGAIQSFGEGGLHNCFFYNGTTERFYIFYREGGNLLYDHSVDGTTWVHRDPIIACPTGHFGVAWHSNKVYLFIEDGAPGNTDFYKGTINDGNGLIAWDGAFNPVNNIFANPMRFGPVWDDTGHIWVVEEIDLLNGRAWESEDDGATWNNRFVPPLADHDLWGLLPTGVDGDMMCFVVDIPNDALEEWLWDRSAGAPITHIRDIAGTNNDIDELQAAINHNYTPWVCWRDGGELYVRRLIGVNWVDELSGQVANLFGYFNFCCDAGEAAYLLVNRPAAAIVYKLGGAGDISWPVPTTYEWYIAGYFVGGSNPFAEEGDLGVFFCAEGETDDGWFILFPPTGIRLSEGHATGSFRTEAVTASGSIVYWGLLNSENIEVYDDWSILDNANALLLGGIETPYDLHYEGGLDPAETVVKVKCDLEDTGVDPYVTTFDITERINQVTLDTDYEDCFVGVSKLADLAGAEFWVEKVAGVYTLHFSLRRGLDKTNLVVLKNSKTPDYPDVEPNIKFLENTFDWDSYANCIQVIGGTVAGVRAEATLKDHTEIAAFGQEVWKTVRDAEILVDSMARQKAVVELQKRKAVTLRITGRFLDEYDPKDIEIGDSVTLVAEWDEGALKISGSHRIIQLMREYGAGGEQVGASFSNQMRAAEYWAYMSKTDTHDRWLTA